MATYDSTATSGGHVAQGYTSIGLQAVTCSLTVADLTAALGDIWNLFYIPQGATVIGLYIDSPALDSGSALKVDVGDSTADTTYASAGTLLQTAFTDDLNAGNGFTAGAFPTTYTADDTIFVKVSTAATTFASSGTIHAILYYTMNVSY